ncbi:hypothetical protein ODZ83_05440 [Acaricomes phytoseiuli]|uniref:hypothetical protein n=1 Tax=Acaricomes phytoseiuli TaxID=291968 RepID=UPI0022234C98|nr:hypothetical protein [Acaricomes phytoseiuli]MCW1249634.1 hypothetical protein [Acaricomes phytoseiuli]
MSYKTPLDYIDVATRIVDFRKKHPEGSLQTVSIDFKDFADKCWVIYQAAAYRAPDDLRPGMGMAWEPVPGPTNFTRDSELQNAETAAWGRAIVAALAADTKQGIASSEEVRNRQRPAPWTAEQVRSRIAMRRGDVTQLRADFVEAKSAGTPQELLDLIVAAAKTQPNEPVEGEIVDE